MKTHYFLPLLLGCMINPVWAESISLNQVSGMETPNKAGMVRIPQKYTVKPEYIQKKVLNDLERMIIAAKKEGIDLKVISAFRSFSHQKSIWERKWRSYSGDDKTRVQRILQYSTPPAFSRHHWGTEVDLNSLKLAYWRSATGQKTYAWLNKNAKKFGFCQVYSANRKSGHTQEVWHWSHIRSARPYYQVRIKNLDQGMRLSISGSRVLTPQLLHPYVSSIQTCGL